MTPDQYCRDKTGGGGSSFYYSVLFLPAEQRRAVTALHALRRELEDVVDQCQDPAVAGATLAWWRQEIENTYNGGPNHPVCQALLPAVRKYPLEKAQFHAMIDGLAANLATSRYATFDALRQYCQRAASVPWRLSASILGGTDERVLGFAGDLGIALQLTAIIRDAGAHARQGRVYLPLEDLQRFGVTAEALLQGKESQEFYALMAFERERAEQYYEQALSRLPDGERARQLPGIIMAAIQRALLAEIAKDGDRVLRHRLHLTPLRKLWIAWRTRRRERRRGKIRRKP